MFFDNCGCVEALLTICFVVRCGLPAPPPPPLPATCPQLIDLGAPTLFATHFHQLTELTALYPAAKVGGARGACRL